MSNRVWFCKFTACCRCGCVFDVGVVTVVQFIQCMLWVLLPHSILICGAHSIQSDPGTSW